MGQAIEILMFEALPDLCLPTAIVIFNGRLEAGFLGRREDRGDAELQSEPDHTSQGVTVDPVSQKDGAIIELDVFRQIMCTPVGDDGLDRESGCPGGSYPTAAETAVQADGVEDHDVGATPNDEAFHEIEAVEFRLLGSYAWQIPAFGGRRTANSLAPIESAATQEDSADGADRGNPFEAAFYEGTTNGGRAEFTEVAGDLELRTQLQDQVLESLRCRPGRTSPTARRVCPVNTIATLSRSASDPLLDSCQRDVKSPRDESQRLTALHGSDHSPPHLLHTFLKSSWVLGDRKFSLHSDRL